MEDPTLSLCRLEHPLKGTPNFPPSLKVPALFDFVLEPGRNKSAADLSRYEALQVLKTQFNHPRFEQARNEANPFETLGSSVFINRAAVKLANVDALYGISNHINGYADWQTPGRFTFCDIAGGPGSFTQYLQWRRPDSQGFGITLKGKLDWQWRALDQKRFISFSGRDGTGDLYKYWLDFVKFVRGQQVPGVDAVVADGGFEIGESYREQETRSGHLIAIECLMALLLLADNGSFMCKFFDTISAFSIDLFLALSPCFEELVFIKPISSRPANAEKYLVAKGYRGEKVCKPVIDILYQVVTQNLSEGFLSMPDSLTPALDYLTQVNQICIQRQEDTANEIIRRLEKPIPTPLQYDIHRCFLYWNLPDTPFKGY